MACLRTCLQHEIDHTQWRPVHRPSLQAQARPRDQEVRQGGEARGGVTARELAVLATRYRLDDETEAVGENAPVVRRDACVGTEEDVDQGLAKALDQMQICEVRRVWAFSLDLGEWDTLQSCFHPDAKRHGLLVFRPDRRLHRALEDAGGGAQARGAPQALARQYAHHDQRNARGAGDRRADPDPRIHRRRPLRLHVLGALLRPVREARRGLADFRMELHLRQGPAGSGDPLVGCLRLVRQGGAGRARERLCVHEVAAGQTRPDRSRHGRDPRHRRRAQASPPWRKLARRRALV